MKRVKKLLADMMFEMSELALLLIFPLLGMSITSISGFDAFLKCSPILTIGLVFGILNLINVTNKDRKIKKLEKED